MTPEAFLSLRSHFASSHALLCISHWVLGIGDRHLSNFMINTETGGMIGIDFGHAFGSATQVLYSLKFLSLLHLQSRNQVCLRTALGVAETCYFLVSASARADAFPAYTSDCESDEAHGGVQSDPQCDGALTPGLQG